MKQQSLTEEERRLLEAYIVNGKIDRQYAVFLW
jgi:hypothetical protein